METNYRTFLSEANNLSYIFIMSVDNSRINLPVTNFTIPRIWTIFSFLLAIDRSIDRFYSSPSFISHCSLVLSPLFATNNLIDVRHRIMAANKTVLPYLFLGAKN